MTSWSVKTRSWYKCQFSFIYIAPIHNKSYHVTLVHVEFVKTILQRHHPVSKHLMPVTRIKLGADQGSRWAAVESERETKREDTGRERQRGQQRVRYGEDVRLSILEGYTVGPVYFPVLIQSSYKQF